jgi:hypothetical protein
VLAVPLGGSPGGSGSPAALTRSATDLERAVAVAADVVAGGRTSDVAPVDRYRDPAWWRWQLARVDVLPLWLLAGLLGALGLGLGLRRRRG